MFTIVIPTLWKASELEKMLPALDTHPYVAEIIIINNNSNSTPEWFKNRQWNKVVNVDFGKNTYVNYGWNFGVRCSETDAVCLLSDDVFFDTSYIFEYLSDKVGEEYGPIGVGLSCYPQSGLYSGNVPASVINWTSADLKREMYGYGYGCILFVNKKTFSPIPEQFRIYNGDNYIILSSLKQKKIPRKLCNFTVHTNFSVTSGLVEFNKVTKQDIEEFRKIIPNWEEYYAEQLDVLNNV